MVASRHFRSDSPRGPLPRARARARAPLGGGLTCLLTTLHPERGLDLALVQHLAGELPDIDFTLEEERPVDVVWVCGYERGNAGLIQTLRARHAGSVLLVTAKEPEELWAGEVLSAGADHALAWPVDFARLARALRRRPAQRRA